MTDFKHALGSNAVDKITGYEGIIVAKMVYLHGSRRYVVQSQKLTSEGKPVEICTFDEPALTVTPAPEGITPEDHGLPKINLGDTVQDITSKYKGIVIAVTTWLHGCHRYVVQSEEFFEGRPVTNAFDEDTLELVKASIPQPVKKAGGWAPTPTQRATPKQR